MGDLLSRLDELYAKARDERSTRQEALCAATMFEDTISCAYPAIRDYIVALENERTEVNGMDNNEALVRAIAATDAARRAVRGT